MKKPEVSEEELRTSTDSWSKKLEIVFENFDLYSDSFKREVRSNTIIEVAKKKKISLEKATKLVDKDIIDDLDAFIFQELLSNQKNREAVYDLFRDIKAGRFNEFINI